MESVLDDLRARARILHTAVRARDPESHERVRALAELRELSEDALVSDTQRKHCLSVIARELGFAGWQHLTRVCEGEESQDFGTFLHAPSCAGHWNIWSASYDEAREIRAQHGGYLLPYKHQFMIVDRHYIESLGLDPDDARWERMERDWVRPASPEARAELCEQLLRCRERSVVVERASARRGERSLPK